ncbi:hypothetical protein L2E82_38261 [Cichorium intybus]|uniref:Uncharacterized protein n=1 Tax=Cichorium intybus TaxID=13427 RepID=A0ACB9AFJ5_CICIN|nr:hypothetical protein L2E82_38261 [Cichorium intybus]
MTKREIEKELLEGLVERSRFTESLEGVTLMNNIERVSGGLNRKKETERERDGNGDDGLRLPRERSDELGGGWIAEEEEPSEATVESSTIVGTR